MAACNSGETVTGSMYLTRRCNKIAKNLGMNNSNNKLHWYNTRTYRLKMTSTNYGKVATAIFQLHTCKQNIIIHENYEAVIEYERVILKL
ncbi:predicted protein [Sclerotinia sclerotiorum 1980 UF-70]|uniref:Uncharacterized protein n=1 Tax=Sclerotinia sclerotiorum (strain ATCC 18683 / 1980 / Ss-1) TaxID=665079 RepID=A7F2D5_SCLS1|nr:predicted protein [Sclerotinia sclerotiorum 1980 UF-70]EDN95877.1 predicted protein [Sclerotinia sclerotiorum 1980 UF-70]